jgi:hypothetical protein
MGTKTAYHHRLIRFGDYRDGSDLVKLISWLVCWTIEPWIPTINL